MKTEWWSICLVIMGTVVGSFGALYLKLGIDRVEMTVRNVVFNTRIWLGIFLYVASTPFFIYALKGGQLSVLYPMVSFGYIWVAISSRVFLKEKINTYKAVGIAFIVLGIVVIGLTAAGPR